MESRKIQKVGTSTLTISLPRSWATARNLKKGDQVFLIEEGETLKVIPASSIQDRRRAAEEYVIDAAEIPWQDVDGATRLDAP